MIDKIIQKTGAKLFAILSAAVAAAATLLLEEISKYYAKKGSYQKGVETERERQETYWTEKVEKVKEDANMTIKQKMEKLRKLKEDFREYVKKNESSESKNTIE